MEGFSERIAFAMEQRSISQTSLAKLVGLTQPEISNYVRGKSYPRLPIIQLLAYQLHVDYRWLKVGEGNYKIETKDYPIEMFHSNFQERLTWLIWSRNENLQTLSKKLGLSSSTLISYWLEGSRIPSADMMNKLSDLFAISEQWLAPKINEPAPDFY